ncbi:MAG: restriction endonuclease subunit S [Giesbergeria sp.]|nr:restriction endonuclease subunit S [Giesbergeria sp.]MBP6159760.1 restriction endonuclease subunit S [Giesbergeria sp.]MBP7083514.1 restriction endonuclease subunit S [Giesbergeria sp.]MBP9785297.1 restriction endonuclease subunit S [Giesbergeria sp.]MBP9894789.1 restriction endonuclease subunit S [Giesbergeria sp.]
MSFPTQMLQDLGTIHTGSTPKTNDESLFGGDIPFVTPGDLGEITPIHTATRSLTDEGAKTGTLLPAGSVLVCCIGSLGKIGFAGRPLVTNQQINAIVFDGNKIDPRYGFFACRLLKPQLESMAPATTVPIVNKSRFSELNIPVPPLEEQRRIAAILDQAETLRTQRRTALALLDRLTQSLFLDLFGDPATNPKNWPVKKLKDLGKVITGGTPPSSKEGMFDGPIPFITPGDLESDEPVRRSITEAGAQEVDVVRAGSTLVCCIGATIGKVGIALKASAFNQQLNAIVWGNEIIDHFGFEVMRFFKPTIKAWGASTTLPILKKSSFEQIEIPTPPIELQKKFSTRLAQIIHLKKINTAAMIDLNELFLALQSKAFAGEV